MRVSAPVEAAAVEQAGRAAPLRVCHLGKYYPPARGGIETHVQGLARAQAGRGLRVRVLCMNHADGGGDDVSWSPLARTRTVRERDGAVEVIRLGRQANVARLDVSARLPLVLRDVLRDGVDVVHLHVPNPTFLLAVAALPLAGAALVVTHHSDVIRQRLLRHVIRPVEEVVYRRASAILATSSRYVAGSDLLRAHAHKVSTVPLGVRTDAWAAPDPAEVARFRARVGGAPSEPLWISVGRLVYYKGLSTAVRALADVPGRWVVVGSGPEEPALRAQAAALGVADRIVWVGELPRGELVAAYQLATALWFPSDARSEAFGLVQVEAMAAGCPVINCEIAGSGVPWVARDGEEAITVAPGDAEAFAAAARRLIETSGLRERLAAGARARAKEFELEALAARTVEVYGQALKRT